MEKKATRRSLNKEIKAVFGMTYSVEHAGGQNDILVSDQLIKPWHFEIDEHRKVIKVTLIAYAGNHGNVVNLEIPFVGISALDKIVNRGGNLDDLLKLKKWKYYVQNGD